jgi:hypothetical protein
MQVRHLRLGGPAMPNSRPQFSSPPAPSRCVASAMSTPKNQQHCESLRRRKRRKEKEFSLEHRQKNGGAGECFFRFFWRTSACFGWRRIGLKDGKRGGRCFRGTIQAPSPCWRVRERNRWRQSSCVPCQVRCARRQRLYSRCELVCTRCQMPWISGQTPLNQRHTIINDLS